MTYGQNIERGEDRRPLFFLFPAYALLAGLLFSGRRALRLAGAARWVWSAAVCARRTTARLACLAVNPSLAIILAKPFA